MAYPNHNEHKHFNHVRFIITVPAGFQNKPWDELPAHYCYIRALCKVLYENFTQKLLCKNLQLLRLVSGLYTHSFTCSERCLFIWITPSFLTDDLSVLMCRLSRWQGRWRAGRCSRCRAGIWDTVLISSTSPSGMCPVTFCLSTTLFQSSKYTHDANWNSDPVLAWHSFLCFCKHCILSFFKHYGNVTFDCSLNK